MYVKFEAASRAKRSGSPARRPEGCRRVSALRRGGDRRLPLSRSASPSPSCSPDPGCDPQGRRRPRRPTRRARVLRVHAAPSKHRSSCRRERLTGCLSEAVRRSRQSKPAVAQLTRWAVGRASRRACVAKSVRRASSRRTVSRMCVGSMEVDGRRRPARQQNAARANALAAAGGLVVLAAAAGRAPDRYAGGWRSLLR
jgi:hypothetical protein